MQGFIVKQPYSSQIINGTKKYEFRNFKTARLTIPIYLLSEGMVLGKIMFTEIKENNKDLKYAWKIKVLKKLTKPWRYSHPQGAQRWVKTVKPKRGKTTSKDRSHFVPEVNDEVLVTFEHGDIKKPTVIGSIWNKANKPPEANSSKKAIKKMKKKIKAAETRTRSMKKSTSTKTKKTWKTRVKK